MNRIVRLFIAMSLLIILVCTAACGQNSSIPTETIEHTETQQVQTETVTEAATEEETQAPTVEDVIKAPTVEEKSIVLNNSYTTKFQEVNAVTYPPFIFDYPDNWEITQEEVTGDSEVVTLSNNEGAEIKFSTYFFGKDFNFSQRASTFGRVEVSEVASSQFVPSFVQGTDHSDLGEFMVAKLKQTGIMYISSGDSDYRDIDGAIEYAVLPKSEIGTKTELTGHYEGEFAFRYGAFVSFIGRDTEDDFTKEEQREVITILNSFRLA